MAQRGNRRGGRGEALLRLLQKTADSPEKEEFSQDTGVQGSSSHTTKPMGRSAALMKLLESVSSPTIESPSGYEQPSGIEKKKLVMGRGTVRSSFSETSVTAGPSRSFPTSGLGSSTSGTSSRELEPHYTPRGRVRYDPSSSESVYFGNNEIHRGSLNVDWSRTAATSSVISPVDLRHWAVICTNRDEKIVNAFVDMYRRCTPQLGIQMNNPKILTVQNDRIQSYMKELQSTQGRNLQIIVIVFPVCRVDKYSAVKKWCCIENPVPSQVILTHTIRRQEKLRTVTQKIALQVNCKLGGALWSVDIPLKCAMVVGLDTFHDSLIQGQSVGAVVASLNKVMSRWYSKIYTQKPGFELIDGLEISILACLQKFKEVNGVYPEQIIIYRDGVGDGQLNSVEQYELPQIITACRRISPNYDPKFLFVIVQKRINTRIFTEQRGDFVNPAPGTVLDHTITRKHHWDFFLVSQSVRQGTVSPSHYIVLYNTTKMSPDQVQRLSYKLTHLYYNWCGTVRVPAPCQYAHKLAALVGESIHKEASESLADKLFFL